MPGRGWSAGAREKREKLGELLALDDAELGRLVAGISGGLIGSDKLRGVEVGGDPRPWIAAGAFGPRRAMLRPGRWRCAGACGGLRRTARATDPGVVLVWLVTGHDRDCPKGDDCTCDARRGAALAADYLGKRIVRDPVATTK